MDKELDKRIHEMAFRTMLDIDIDANGEFETFIQMYGKENVETAIVRNGVSTVLLQKYYDAVRKLSAPDGEKERNI